MALDFQVTIDCSAPHVLADWWAEVLGWEVEAQDEAFIRRMVDGGYATEDDTMRHRGALVWRMGAAIISPEPGRPRVLFQHVPEPKTVKNRLHLDVRVGAGAAGGGGRAPAGAGRDRALAGVAGAVRVGDARRPGGQRVLRRLTPDLSWRAGPARACGRRPPARP